MSDASPPPAPGAPPKTLADLEGQLEALVERYIDQLHAGLSPDRRALLAAHPELADVLERRLALVEMIHGVARERGASAVPPDANPGPVPQGPLRLPSQEAPTRVEVPSPVRASDGKGGEPKTIRIALGPIPPGGEEVELTPAAGGEPPSVRFKCPHCGNRIQLPRPAPPEVVCLNCGSIFRLQEAGTASYRRADLPERIGKFQVLDLIGQGGFGAVYKARDPELQRTVAIKMPRAGYFGSPEEEERFLREARSAARLKHPGIVPVHEIGRERGLPYIVSDYVEGLTLSDLLTGGRPAIRQTAELLAQVADALDYAHAQDVIHRDVKPSNILLDRTGRPYLTDFGLARRGDEAEVAITLDGQILGTPAYMSPEQAAADQSKVDGRSDVYCLGVILYELLTGELPFRGNTRMLLHQVLHDEPKPPRRLIDRIPRDLETICLKAMAKAPGKRYATAGELADDLRRFLRGEPVRARRQGSWERGWSWAKRKPWIAGLSGAVLLLLVIVAVVATAAAFSIAGARRTAETNARKARAAVDQMLTEAAEEGLADTPQMDPARRRLLEKALAFYQDFLTEKPTDPALRQELARAHRRVGNISQMLGRTEDAKRAYHEAVDLFTKLTADFPAEADYRHELAMTYNDLGELLRVTGQPGAEESYASALELQEKLVQESPREAPDYRKELARTYNNRGILRKDARRLPEAAKDYERAVALLRPLVGEFPGEPAYRVGLARACTNRGVLLRHMNRRREAEEAYGEAITLLTDLIPPRESRGARDYRYKLAVAHVNLGNLLAERADRRPEAEKAQRQAIALLDNLVLQFPDSHVYRRDLANGYNGLGYVLEDTGRLADAGEAYRHALALFKELVEDFPEVAEYESLTAMTLNNLGWLALGSEEWETGELLVLTVLPSPGLPASPSLALAGVSGRLLRRDRLAEACRLFEQAVDRQKAALKPDPENPVYRQRLGDHYRNLARAAVRMGDHVKAARAAEDLCRYSPESAADCCHAARFLALCAALAEIEPAPPGAAPGEAARAYADRAVRLLRDAVDLGYKDARDLRENADFTALRPRGDFQTLLKTLEAAPINPP
jgi:tetratricopeptide (TPR) repeat protein